jgi:hypothetical protein
MNFALPSSDQPPAWVGPIICDAFHWFDAKEAELGTPMTFEERLDMTVTLPDGRKEHVVLTVKVEQKA